MTYARAQLVDIRHLLRLLCLPRRLDLDVNGNTFSVLLQRARDAPHLAFPAPSAFPSVSLLSLPAVSGVMCSFELAPA